MSWLKFFEQVDKLWVLIKLIENADNNNDNNNIGNIK